MTPTATLLTPDQLSKMSTTQQQAYLAGLTPDQATAERTALANYHRQMVSSNTTYLRKSYEKYAICPPNGGGVSATYASGTSLVFNLPSAGGAYLKELIVEVDIKFTPATGTSATYGWTPAGAMAWFSDININYGGQTLHHIRPYFLKVMETIRFKQWLANASVLSGLGADSTTTGLLSQAQPTLTGGTAAVSKFRFRIPMQLQKNNPIGLLPIQGQGTAGQITLTTAATLGAANPDPMQVPINYTGGSGNGITLDSTEKTITVKALYVDGSNYENKQPMSLSLDGLPASMYVVDQPLNNLTSGSVQRNRITSQMVHYLAASVIIDGVQSTAFTTEANVTSIELDQDAAGQNKFWYYGAGNNTDFANYLERIRHTFGQDLDMGVILWTDATQFGTVDADNADGTQVLDMRAGHWSNVNYGVQVGSVSTTNFTPRIETYLFSMNDAGLIVAG